MNPFAAVSLRARMRATSLGAKLALVGAVLAAAILGGTFFALRISTAESVRSVFVSEMHASQATLRRTKQHDRMLLLRRALLVAGAPTLHAAVDAWRAGSPGDALATQRVRTIENEIKRVYNGLDADLLVVTDAAGIVLTSTGAAIAPPAGTSLDRLPAVHAALTDDDPAPDSVVGVLASGFTAIEIAAVPILVDGYAIGAVVLGERIDRTIPSDSTYRTRAVVTSDSTVLTSTLETVHGGETWRPRTSAAANAMATLLVAGHEYVAATIPLGRGDSGQPVMLYLLRSLDDAIDPIEASITRRFLLAGLLAILLIGAGGIVVSRTTLRPLSQFVGFMESASHTKHYGQFVETDGTPTEIRALTDTYNRLIDSLRLGNQELERRTVDLAKANHRLNRQIERRERAEHALRESEEHLRQAQKLEALGSLAGGVAHDFNNILSIILGYAEIVQGELRSDSSQHADVAKIRDAAGRARALVRQLLAFSRKQVLQPQVLDLNHIVAGVQPLLRPLLGEDVVLDVRLSPQLAQVTADPGQIEQVIVNLAVNARDAMPAGGRLVIETSNVTLEDRGGDYPVSGGRVAMLSVADTGIGMDAVTRGRIFEPFFTTKPVGKGTGLGLATVYGIVRQSGGNITVFSEPGKGSVFRCYFPAVEAAREHAPEAGAARPRSGGAETILIAEDEVELRALMRRALQQQGYVVLEAGDGVEALQVAADHDGIIHLLVSDVVMPELSGTELARQLLRSRPDLRVLFVSGYSDEAIERQGMLAPDSVFLEKPISPDTLAHAVRELLDAEPMAAHR